MKNSTEIYHILVSGSKEEQLQLFKELPDNSMKSASEFLVGTHPGTYLAFSHLVPSYAFGKDFETGFNLGLALYRFGKEWIQSGKTDILVSTLLGMALNTVNAAMNLGGYQQALDFIECEEPIWLKYFDHPEFLQSIDQSGVVANFKSLRVAKIGILMELQRVQEAWELSEEKDYAVGNPSSDIEYHRLRKIIEQLIIDPGQLAGNANTRKMNAKAAKEESLEVITESMLSFLDGNNREISNSLKTTIQSDPNTKAGFAQLLVGIEKGEKFILGEQQSDDNEIRIRNSISRASGIFVDNQPSKEVIEASLSILLKEKLAAERLGNLTILNDALYGLYLCYSRLQNSTQAVDQLLYIRRNLEKQRDSLTDPMKKAGAFQAYPHLFHALVEHCFKSGRTYDLLDAIEGSKGRVITDTLLQRTRNTYIASDNQEIASKLGPLLATENTHYLTYHLDDNVSYACLLTKGGYIHSTCINIGQDKIQRWVDMRLQDPDNWNKQIFEPINIQQELSPFILWISRFFEDGTIASEDHLCYSPDHLLYLFPLHYAELNGEPLINHISVSRIHNAGHLIHLMAKKPLKPSKALMITVPSAEDGPEVFADFNSNCQDLSTLLGLKNLISLSGKNAGLEQLWDHLGPEKIIHFSTHGFFPESRSPFTHSGLLLADHEKNPALHIEDLEYDYSQEGLHLMSPQRLLLGFDRGSAEVSIEGSHVSLLACVTGQAKEGVGGDALGLEWALLVKGAASVISTHWNVDIATSAKFYRYFYTSWIKEGCSKAKAHRRAMLKLKKDSESVKGLPPEYLWSPYTLVGDWR